MFTGDVDTLRPDWHKTADPGLLVSPNQAIDKDEYLHAFTKCLSEYFKEEVLHLLRVDTSNEKQALANRWGDEASSSASSSSSSSSIKPYTSHTTATSTANVDNDGVSTSQEERQHKKEKHYGLAISHRLLCDACPLLAHAVIHALQSHTTDTEEQSHGDIVWEAFNEAALQAQVDVYKAERTMIEECNRVVNEEEEEGEEAAPQSSQCRQELEDLSRELSIKHNVNVRLVDLCGGLRKPNVSSIRSYDVGSFVEIGGTCTRTGAIKMVESQRYYKCNAERCQTVFSVYADVDRGYGIDEPKGCTQSACKSKSVSPQVARAVCRDCQELRLQEHATKLAGEFEQPII